MQIPRSEEYRCKILRLMRRNWTFVIASVNYEGSLQATIYRSHERVARLYPRQQLQITEQPNKTKRTQTTNHHEKIQFNLYNESKRFPSSQVKLTKCRSESTKGSERGLVVQMECILIDFTKLQQYLSARHLQLHILNTGFQYATCKV